MTARRRLLAAASATCALVALTGCQKPAPLVTLVSGGESVYSEAAVYCFDEGQTLDGGGCAERDEDKVTELPVREGERIGVDVDKELVDKGWRLQIVDPANPERRFAEEGLAKHYFAFAAPPIQPGGSLTLTVQSLDAQQQPTGQWQFSLVDRA